MNVIGTIPLAEYLQEYNAAAAKMDNQKAREIGLHMMVLIYMVQARFNYNDKFTASADTRGDACEVVIKIERSDVQGTDVPLGFTPLFTQDGNLFFLLVSEAFKVTRAEAHGVGYGLTSGEQMIPGLIYTGECVIVSRDTEHVHGEILGMNVAVVSGPQFDVHRAGTSKHRSREVLWAEFRLLFNGRTAEEMHAWIRALTPIEVHTMLNPQSVRGVIEFARALQPIADIFDHASRAWPDAKGEIPDCPECGAAPWSHHPDCTRGAVPADAKPEWAEILCPNCEMRACVYERASGEFRAFHIGESIPPSWASSIWAIDHATLNQDHLNILLDALAFRCKNARGVDSKPKGAQP